MSLFTSLHGRRLGLGQFGQLVTNSSGESIDLSPVCVDATVTVSAEGATTANVRDIVIQLKDAEGKDVSVVTSVELVLFLDAGRVDFAGTGGSTGIAEDGTGNLLAVVAKKVFLAQSDVAGALVIKWTDTGTEVAFLGIKFANGTYVMSTALTNAA